jgi:hypothetical protein
MNKSVKTIVKLNLKNIRAAYIATIAGIGALGSNYISYYVMASQGMDLSGNENVGIAWALWALPVAAAIIIPARHFRRILSLGGRRDNFFLGSLITYVLLAGIASLIGIVLEYAESSIVAGTLMVDVVWTPAMVFGWAAHGPVVAFLQQFAFLFLTAAFTHTFVAAQGKWYGWASFIGALVVLCVFLPIEPLRNIVIGYAYLVMFNPNALLQIIACAIAGLGFYWLNKPIFARKTI